MRLDAHTGKTLKYQVGEPWQPIVNQIPNSSKHVKNRRTKIHWTRLSYAVISTIYIQTREQKAPCLCPLIAYRTKGLPQFGYFDQKMLNNSNVIVFILHFLNIYCGLEFWRIQVSHKHLQEGSIPSPAIFCRISLMVKRSSSKAQTRVRFSHSAPFWVVRIAAIAGDCKSPPFGVRWFESSTAHHFIILMSSSVVELSAVNRLVVGSNPTSSAMSPQCNGQHLSLSRTQQGFKSPWRCHQAQDKISFASSSLRFNKPSRPLFSHSLFMETTCSAMPL